MSIFNRNARKMTKKSRADLIAIEQPEQLLQEQKRQGWINQIETMLSLDVSSYQKNVTTLFHHLTNYYQKLPAPTPYFSHRGGLMDHAIHRAEAGLDLFRQILILDKNKTPSEQQQRWLYTFFSAALLQGIGKLYTDYRIEVYDYNTQFATIWQPLKENLTTAGAYYDYEFLKGDDLSLQNHITPLLARQLMPKSGFSWIASDPETLQVWLALLLEDKETAGPLAAILDRANAVAIQAEIHAYLLKHQDFDSRKRLGAFADGSAEALLQREQWMGAEFIAWLMQSLESGKILINQSPVLMEILPTGIVMSPQLFDMFAQEHLKFKNKNAIRNAFFSWNLHRLLDAANDHEKTKQGLLLDTAILPEKIKIFHANTHKIHTVKTLDLIHQLQQHQVNANDIYARMNHLSSSGQWVSAEDINVATHLQNKV